MSNYTVNNNTKNDYSSSLAAGDTLTVGNGYAPEIVVPAGKYTLNISSGSQWSSSYNSARAVGTLNLSEPTSLFCQASGVVDGGYTVSRYCKEAHIMINSDSMYSRVLVAGGQPGSAQAASGANGPNTSTTYRDQYYTRQTLTLYGGGAGTQTSGGAGGYYNDTGSARISGYLAGGAGGFGTSGLGRNSNAYGGASGGGQGWYGGGGGMYLASATSSSTTIISSSAGPGGGGSSYIYTSSTAKDYPSGCLLNSGYYLTDTAISSVKQTNGSVVITAVEVASSMSASANIGGSWKDSDKISVNIGGTWKDAEKIFVNVDGVWMEQ